MGVTGSKKLPDSAEIVIIGGGIIGCSTAYHLAAAGAREVLLLEQGQLSCGTTWHAAGLVGQLRSSANITRLLNYSVELYQRLEQETGLATGWKMNGGLQLACNQDRWIEIKRRATTAHSFDLPMELLTPQQALEMWPMMDISDVVGAAFLPTDGQANPSDITRSLASGARHKGAKIYENTPVTAITVNADRVTGVVTDRGTIRCEKLVNCGGQWARKLGAMAGVNVPLQSVEHQYMVTEPLAEPVPGNLPTLRDPDRLLYFKEEVGGLVMGGYEHNPVAWARQGFPEHFHFSLLNSNWDLFEQHMEQALIRVPALAETGVKTLINGPESFTPDGNFILGEAPEVENFFVGAGFNAFGIAAAGGAGKALAEWVLAGEPPFDLWPVDIRRFGTVHRDPEFVCNRTLESYGRHYSMDWPQQEFLSERPRLVSPLYPLLKARGACFGSKLGWERPNWFAIDGQEPHDRYSYGRANWFDAVAAEHRAVREAVAVFDQSSFAKFVCKGPDAARVLSWLCANEIERPVGTVVYTQLLNDHGGIECDLTVCRVAEDEFYLVTGTGFRSHDLAWIRSQMPIGAVMEIKDLTEQWGTLAVMGPQTRNVLQQLTTTDLSNTAFPFASTQTIEIAGQSIRALRITFVGELGWELHMPNNAMPSVYAAIMAAGEKVGIRDAGYRAIESLRLEKAYRVWSTDLTADRTPYAAGLSWAVKMASGKDFKGRAALAVLDPKRPPQRLCCFTVADPDVVLHGRESIYRNAEQVGYLTSAGWGYTANCNIGYGYVQAKQGVDLEYLRLGQYELEVACQRVACRLQLRPLYDPQQQKIRT